MSPIIILTLPRSFSSVVTAMIGQHPSLYGLPELHLFTGDTLENVFEFHNFSGSRGDRRADGLLRALAELSSGKQNAAAIFLLKKWLKQNGELPTTQVIEKLIDAAAPRRIVEKSITTAWNDVNLGRALALHPDSRFIHLLRHPRGYGLSCEKLRTNYSWQLQRGMFEPETDPPIFDPQYSWQRGHERIQAALASLPPERYTRLRGEDVLQDPAGTFSKLLPRLGVENDAAAIADMMHPENSPFASVGPDNAPMGSDHLFLSSPEFRPGYKLVHGLDGPVEWRDDGKEFTDGVRALAESFGYS